MSSADVGATCGLPYLGPKIRAKSSPKLFLGRIEKSNCVAQQLAFPSMGSYTHFHATLENLGRGDAAPGWVTQ